MIKEAQTIHLFRQEHDDDIADCVRYFNLEQSNAAALGALPQGDHLLKVGTHKEIRVHHRRTPRETDFTATDSAMLPPPPADDGRRAAEWDALMSRPDQRVAPISGWAGRINGPGCSPPGSSPPSSPSPAASALLALWHLPWCSPPASRSPATSASPCAGCSPLAPLDLPARYHPADPVTTLTVFGVLLRRRGRRVRVVGGPTRTAPAARRAAGGRWGWPTGRQARRSAGEIRAREQGRVHPPRPASTPGCWTSTPHRWPRSGCCSGTTTDDR